MKPIPKTSRESNRYIACTIMAASPVTYTDFSAALEKTALEMVGKLGIASLGLQLIKDQYQFPRLVIKTNAGQERIARAIICAISTAGSQKLRVDSIRTSGTINHVAVVQNNYGHKSAKKKASANKTIQTNRATAHLK